MCYTISALLASATVCTCCESYHVNGTLIITDVIITWKGLKCEMSQVSMFDMITIPESFEDIDRLLERVREEETDEDLFSFSDTSAGRSYSFYGTKVFEFLPKKNGKGSGKIKACPEILIALGQATAGEAKQTAFSVVAMNTENDVIALIEALKVRKRYLFRNLITETFGCCNDFMRCSEAECCIHQNDRFYNGCTYRTNLEQGKIFYGSKRNID